MRSTYIIRTMNDTRTRSLIIGFVGTAQLALDLLRDAPADAWVDLAQGTPEEGYTIGAWAYKERDTGRIIYHHPIAPTRFSPVITG